MTKFSINFSFFLIASLLFFQNCKKKQKQSDKLVSRGQIRNDSLIKAFDQKSADEKAYRLDSLFTTLYANGTFNGNVLISENGKVVYKASLGYKNLKEYGQLSLNTPFQLASVSKQFTAVAIMQLMEKGLLKYKDPVWKHVPNFPFDSSITIFSLLTHSSGIPNYIYCLDKVYDKSKPLSNKMVVDLMAYYKPGINYLPNARFNYNNSNYMYLAYIVEKLSGMDFRKYAEKYLFEPAGMKHSFVFDPANTKQIKKAAKGFESTVRPSVIDYLDGVVGDKGIYSTVEDLFLWDTALNTDKLLKTETLKDALSPKLNFKNTIDQNYGFGWRMTKIKDGTWSTFHGGWWHGFKNFYLHDNQNNSSIIVLSNLANGYLQNMKKVNAILYPDKAKYFIETEEESSTPLPAKK